jgi:4-amino-4-deoxy-L-arabinose transferase-like glycosyltransferase
VKSLLKKIQNFDKVLVQELPLLISLLLVVILRIPNFFEPYWYGDEGIYLALGVTMRQGARLYLEIIDHKTPLIYYFAMVPSQLWFRGLTLAWMLVTTTAFYHIALRLFKKILPVTLATITFVLFTTLPWFEGNIPNGELFVMGFMLTGGVLLLYTRYFEVFTAKKTPVKIDEPFHHLAQEKVGRFLKNTKDQVLYIAAGILFGLGILTKVPAVLDAVAFLGMAWFAVANRVMTYPKKFGKWASTFVVTAGRVLIIIAGIAATIAGSIFYFMIRGSGQAYLDYGLLYNFRYVQAWSLPFDDPLLVFLFSLPGKMLVATVGILLLTFIRKKISPAIQFAAGWLILSLFASLLSNRPYPHYFLQVAPAFSLLVGASLTAIWNFCHMYKKDKDTKARVQALSPVIVTLIFTMILGWIMTSLNVGLYPTVKYYQKSISYLTGSISREEYYQSFNHLMKDNYTAAEIISKSPDEDMFIWGTNPMLYALAQKAPVGRFTVAFHIRDFGAYEETMNAVREKQPTFIVVMKNESELDGLQQYLDEKYIMNENFDHFYLWMKR